MASAPSASWNSRCITHLANCPNRSLPTNSSDESEIYGDGKPQMGLVERLVPIVPAEEATRAKYLPLDEAPHVKEFIVRTPERIPYHPGDRVARPKAAAGAPQHCPLLPHDVFERPGVGRLSDRCESGEARHVAPPGEVVQREV